MVSIHRMAWIDNGWVLMISLPMIHQSFTRGLVKDTCPNCMKLVISYLKFRGFIIQINPIKILSHKIYTRISVLHHISSWLLSSTTCLPECMIMIFVVQRWFHTMHLSSTLFNWQCLVQYLLVRIWQWACGLFNT